MAQLLPEDILLLIFDAISPGLSHAADPTHFPASAERAQNSTLAACSLVCRSWAPPAQDALFRHIYLIQTTDVLHNGHFWPVVQRSTNELPSLIRALETRQSTARTLHIGFGEIWWPGEQVDLLTGEKSEDMDDEDNSTLVAAHLALVARAISLCTGLVHLSLYIGTPFDHAHAVFTSSDLRSITSRLPHLRELSFFNLADEVGSDWHIVYRRHYLFPYFALGNQLIRAFQAQLTALTINFAAEPLREALPVLPNLRTFRAGYMPNLLQLQLAAALPVKVCLSAFCAWEDIPKGAVRHLCLHALISGSARDRDLRQFASLETLEILHAKEDVLVAVLGSAAAPPGMRALNTVTLPAASISRQVTVSQLRDIFDALPALKRVLLVGRRGKHIKYGAIASVPVTMLH